jgi:hypothetical protein
VLSLVGAIYVALHYDQAKGGLQLAQTYPFVPSYGIDIRLAADGWSVALFLLTGIIMTAGSWPAATLTNRPKEFYILLLVLVSGVFGVFVCQDLFIFFLFYEIAVLPMYLLIGIWGSKGKVAPAGPFRRSGRTRRRRSRVRRDEAHADAAGRLGGDSGRHAGDVRSAWARKTFDMVVMGQFKFLQRELQVWVFPCLWLGFGSLARRVPVPHLVAGRPRRRAHGRVHAARRRADETRRLRCDARGHGHAARGRRQVWAPLGRRRRRDERDLRRAQRPWPRRTSSTSSRTRR